MWARRNGVFKLGCLHFSLFFGNGKAGKGACLGRWWFRFEVMGGLCEFIEGSATLLNDSFNEELPGLPCILISDFGLSGFFFGLDFFFLVYFGLEWTAIAVFLSGGFVQEAGEVECIMTS